MSDLPDDIRQWPHGTRAGYQGRRCRCEACRSWMRLNERDRRRRDGHRTKAQQIADAKNASLVNRQAFINDPTDESQGTMPGYGRGCRCDRCRAANTRHHAESQRAARTRPTPDHVHGTETGYSYWGCRCEPCRAANAESSRRRRTRA